MVSHTAKLRRLGNSLAIIIPKLVLNKHGLAEGDDLTVYLDDSGRKKRWEAFLALRGSLSHLGKIDWQEIGADEIDEADKDFYRSFSK